MAAPKGHPKYGGRAKGTPNKSTQNLLDICEQEGIEPFRAMLRAFKDIEDPVRQVDALEKICQYLYPKRKAIELSTDEDSGFQIIIKDYSDK